MSTAEESWASTARIVVFGCGGIGGTVAAALSAAGRSVVVVTHNAGITAAVARDGLQARLADGRALVARVDVVTDASEANARRGDRRFDVALLAVPPNRLDEAASAAAELLADDGLFVPLSNGLPEEHLVARFGDGRVVGCIVGFGGSALAPGVVEQTSEGGFTIGRLSGGTGPGGDGVDEGVRRVAALLLPLEPDAAPGAGGPGHRWGNVTTNLRGARFSKLAINCAISSLGTIGGDRLGALMRHRFVRRLCLEVMTEVVQTATRMGVHLEKLSHTIDLEWLALDDEERVASGSPGLLAKHTVLLAVGARYRRLRSSMLAAIERGRPPPIDELNGEIVRLARPLGIPVPVNTAVVERVRAIARGEQRPSVETLRALYDDTREPLRMLRAG
jgi:2-dehydropantoate 2-reductase